jgi:hypothetical protein
LRSADGTLADVPKKVSANIVNRSFSFWCDCRKRVASGTPVVAILHPARAPKATEVRTVVKVTKPHPHHLARRQSLRSRRGDGMGRGNGEHCFRPRRQCGALVAEIADNLRFHDAKSSQTKLRTYPSFTY